MKSVAELKDILFAECHNHYSKAECDLVHDACEILEKNPNEAISEVYFSNILQHNLKVAILVIKELNLDVDSTLAALLSGCQFPPKDPVTNQHILDEFSESSIHFIQNLNRITKLDLIEIQANADFLRKLLINISGDLRVVMIKLVDRIISLREISCFKPELRTKLSTEAMFLYAPLAHRMGLYNIYTELSTRAFQEINPDDYKKIKSELDSILNKNSNFLPDFVSPIEQKLKELNLSYTIKQRIKSPYSIWKKIDNQHITIDKIHDIYATRIIFDSNIEDEKLLCWQIYALVTDIYPPMVSRTRDWISVPRANGYESLHTTVQYTNGVWVEVQIRSKRMDKIAEYGPAAHWSYKDGQQKTSLEKWLGEIRDVLENDRLALGDILESMKPEDISEEIYVFTAKKDSKKEIRRFSKGATILDFAYSIHSEIGNRCVGATVNNISVEKGYVLKNGDAINVQTSKSQKPSLDWLKIATTAKAKYHIRKSLNEEHELLVSNGKEILKRKFKNWKYNFTDSVNDVVQYFGYKFGNDMFYDVATEKLPTIKIKSFLDNKNEYLEGKNTVEIISKTKPKTGNIYLAMTEDDKKINGIYCNCCEVHPGDSVFGFISNTAEIKIHRTNCPNANYLKSRFPYRIIELKWIKT